MMCVQNTHKTLSFAFSNILNEVAAAQYGGPSHGGAPGHGLLGRGLIYTCNLHGSAASPKPAQNKSCVNLTADAPCSVATTGIIRSDAPPPVANCSAGKCVHYDDGKDTAAATALAAKPRSNRA